MRLLLIRAVPCLVAAAVLSPSPAQAWVVTWGDRVNDVGEVSDKYQPQLRQDFGGDVAVGFRYRYWGVFSIDLWTWDGHYCLYRGKTYWPLPAAEAAKLLDQPESELGKPLLYRFPLGLVLLVACVGFFALRMVFAKRLKDKVRPRARDWRYGMALAVMAEHARRANAADAAGADDEGAADSDDAEVAVEYLTRQGVPRAEAEQHLTQLLAAVSADVYRLLEDERYSQALEIMAEHARKGGVTPPGAVADASEDGFAIAVRHLTDQGLSRAEAEHNLALIFYFLPEQGVPDPT